MRLAVLFLVFAQFQAEVRLARVEVRAVDSAQKPLSGLGSSDFRVTENGDEREIAAVSQSEVPLDLILVLDVSGSMEDSVHTVAESAHNALAAIKSGDRVAVLTFNRTPEWHLGLTDDKAAIEAKIEEVAHPAYFGGGTIINTAVMEAAKYLQKHSGRERRRAILMVTDGHGLKGTSSNRVLRELWEGDITVNSLMVETMRGYKRRQSGRRGKTASILYATNADVQDLVEKTGGELLYFLDSKNPFLEMLERIRTRYTLYYRPVEGEKGKRKVIAGFSEAGKAKHPEASAIGRREYLIP